VNLLAEQELTTILKMVAGICRHLNVRVDTENGDVDQLAKDTDINTISAALDRELAETPPEEPVHSAEGLD
jgi:hypothetical protein